MDDHHEDEHDERLTKSSGQFTVFWIIRFFVISTNRARNVERWYSCVVSSRSESFFDPNADF
jgi:hypothetical protein